MGSSSCVDRLILSLVNFLVALDEEETISSFDSDIMDIR